MKKLTKIKKLIKEYWWLIVMVLAVILVVYFTIKGVS